MDTGSVIDSHLFVSLLLQPLLLQSPPLLISLLKGERTDFHVVVLLQLGLEGEPEMRHWGDLDGRGLLYLAKRGGVGYLKSKKSQCV